MTIQNKVTQATAEAISVFVKLYDTAVVSGGSIDIDGGYGATIDCDVTKKRLVLTALDSEPGRFAIAVSDKAASNVLHDILPESELTSATLIKYMEAHFAK